MDNNNETSDWPATPVMFLMNVLAEIKFKHRAEYGFRENSVSKETNENISSKLFECVCTLGNLKSSGLHQNKLNAKHMAAEGMIRQLHKAKLLGRMRIPSTQYIDKNESLGDNPVSKLYELLQMKDLERPSYETDQFGTQYEMRCIIPKLKLETCYRSSSKKLAKREACKLMLEKLMSMDLSDLDLTSDVVPSDFEDSSKFSLNYQNIHSLMGVQNLKGTAINLNTDILAQLQQTSNFIQVLEDLASMFGFTHEFLTIKEKNLINLHQVMARLNTFPIICVPGVGRTVLDAKNAAALQAIEALNIYSRRMAFREKLPDFRNREADET